MRPRLGLCSFVLALAALPAMGEEAHFQSVAIFPSEPKHNHASCVVEMANGDLLAAWYSGHGERNSDDVVIQGAWLRKGEVLWGPRFEMADTPGYPDCNPALLAAPDKTVWLVWPTILDHRWEGALLKFAVARDEGTHSGVPTWIREGVIHITPKNFDKEWEKAVANLPVTPTPRLKEYLERASVRSKDLLYQRMGWMPRVHPVVLKSGRWLMPLYTDTFSVSIVLRSDDEGATWTATQPMIGFGNIQPSIVERKDGTLVAFMRDNGPFRRIRQCESRDQGETWGPVTSSELPNPGAGVEAIRLQSGRWAMIYNDTTSGRHSLALAVSDDEGRTWPTKRHVEVQPPGAGSFHYPSLLQARDGTIHVTYTHGGTPAGSTIQHARFNEAWVLAGGKGAH